MSRVREPNAVLLARFTRDPDVWRDLVNNWLEAQLVDLVVHCWTYYESLVGDNDPMRYDSQE